MAMGVFWPTFYLTGFEIHQPRLIYFRNWLFSWFSFCLTPWLTWSALWRLTWPSSEKKTSCVSSKLSGELFLKRATGCLVKSEPPSKMASISSGDCVDASVVQICDWWGLVVAIATAKETKWRSQDGCCSAEPILHIVLSSTSVVLKLFCTKDPYNATKLTRGTDYTDYKFVLDPLVR